MPSGHARAIYVVSFDCSQDGIDRATRFICDVIPLVYENHRQHTQGFFVSRHFNPEEHPPYNTVWLNCRLDRGQATQRKQAMTDGLREIAIAHGRLRADWKNPDDEDEHFRGTDDEEETFGDVLESCGVEFLPALWVECEFGTLQAYAELTSTPIPCFFHPWSRHIFENVLGRE